MVICRREDDHENLTKEFEKSSNRKIPGTRKKAVHGWSCTRIAKKEKKVQKESTEQ